MLDHFKFLFNFLWKSGLKMRDIPMNVFFFHFCSDDDFGENAEISFGSAQGNATGFFSVDETTGRSLFC